MVKSTTTCKTSKGKTRQWQWNKRREKKGLKVQTKDNTQKRKMHMNNAHFTLGVKAKVEFKSSIPIGAIIEITPTTLH